MNILRSSGLCLRTRPWLSHKHWQSVRSNLQLDFQTRRGLLLNYAVNMQRYTQITSHIVVTANGSIGQLFSPGGLSEGSRYKAIQRTQPLQML